MRCLHCSAIVLVIGVVLSPIQQHCLALDEEPSGVDEFLAPLRQDFEERVTAERVPLLLEFLARLRLLETSLLENRDYANLTKLEVRRLSILAELATVGIDGKTLQGQGAILLEPSAARLSGGVTREAAEQGGAESLTDWSEGGTSTWEVSGIQPGYFAVHAVYASPPAPELEEEDEDEESAEPALGGRDIVSFGETSVVISGATRPLSMALVPTGSSDNIRAVALGTMPLTRTSASVRLRVEESRGTGVMRLIRLYLVRTARQTEERGAPVAEPQTLSLVRNGHRTSLQALRAPAEDAYVEQLEEVYRSIGANSAGGKRIIEEMSLLRSDRADPLEPRIAAAPDPENPTLAQPKLNNPTLLAPAEMTTNIRRGCRLVESPETGDRLTIEHEGEHIPVRLYLVECPSPVETTTSPDLASYFEISTQELALVGERARQFSAETLQDSSFLVREAGEYDDDGRLYVMLQLPALGSLQQLLVSQGLCAIRGKRSTLPNAGRPFVKQVLEVRQRQAQRSLKGAWQF